MPFASFTGTGNGTTKQFTIPFPYVKKDHIVVALDLVANTNFTFVNDTTIEFDTLSSATSTQEATGAPKTGVKIEISRDTPLTNALVDFVDGSTLTAADLDTAVLQLLYGIQEAKDEAALGIQNTPQGQDAQNKPIINVSDPTNAQDAVTKAFLERVGSISSTQILDGTIVNADVNASAAIAGTKISPDFGSQNIATSGTVDGRDVSADGTKLDGIESGATADQTNAEIKTAYEANSDTNSFTDALLAKLNAIEANATTDQTIAEIKALIAGSPLDSSHLANNSVGTDEITNSSVTNNKLADAELVTLAGMPSGTASKLASSTELTSDIADLNQIDGLQKAFFNPLIVGVGDEKEAMKEGCLSFPGLWLMVSRPKQCMIKYQDETGEEKIETYEGVTSRVIQHEFDHMLGYNFTMRVSKLKMDRALKSIDKKVKKYQRLQKRAK